MKKYQVIRYIRFNYLFELFFLSAVISILCIRLYLELLGYPILGTGNLHIAHTLWGGFFMFLSIFGFMTYLNEDFKSFWAVLGGIGFGIFIDELGKFITRDNNYFYQPTFAIMYVVFICIYLLYKSIQRRQLFTKEEYLANSVHLLQQIIEKDLSKEEKIRALHYLSKSDSASAITKLLKQEFHAVTDLPDENISLYRRVKNELISLYSYAISKRSFTRMIALIFIARAGIYLLTALGLLIPVFSHFSAMIPTYLTVTYTDQPLIQSVALVLQAGFTILGALVVSRSRRRGYLFFRDAVLVSVLLVQVFNYYYNPLSAFVSTIVDLLFLSILNYMINRENIMKIEKKFNESLK